MTTSKIRALANEFGTAFVAEWLEPHLRSAMKLSGDAPIAEALRDPYLCLRAIYGVYAFARRGKERQEMADLTLAALEEICPNGDFSEVPVEDAPQQLWSAFESLSEKQGRKSQPALNEGVIAGLFDYAQEIYRAHGTSIAGWVEHEINRTGRIEDIFLDIVDIRGVGPKAASNFLRDTVWVLGLEPKLDHIDRLYVQPIDKWVRAFCTACLPEFEGEPPADWIAAGKISKHVRHSGVSGILFNMGVSYFGIRRVHEVSHFAGCLRNLQTPLEEQPQAIEG